MMMPDRGSLESTLLEAPVFVVGYMHSGTTLLLEILRRHPAIYACTSESKYFELLPVVRRRFPDLSSDVGLFECAAFAFNVIEKGFMASLELDVPQEQAVTSPELLHQVVDEVYLERTYGAVFRCAANALTRAARKERWLEKTPTHIFSIDEIVSAVPNALFVEIVRDPRDVLASKKTRRLTVWSGRYRPEQRYRKHLEKAFDPVWDSMSWKSAIRAGWSAKQEHAEQVITVRYEDLVSDPELVVRNVCAYLNLPYDPGMLEVTTRNAADWTKKQIREHGITTRSVGRWREVLSSAELSICQRLVAGEMARLGYRVEPTPLSANLKAIPLTGRSMLEFWIRLQRKWRLGGTAYLLAVLSGYRGRLAGLVRR